MNIKKLGIIILTKTICIFLLFRYVFGIMVVKDVNMVPTIKAGSLIIYYRLESSYKRGDIIIKNNNIYRVSATPYEIIDIDNGRVSVNYYKEDDYFLNTYKNEESNITYPYALGRDEYFLLNDNRYDYNDSRSFGSVKKNKMKGVVITKLQVRDF